MLFCPFSDYYVLCMIILNGIESDLLFVYRFNGESINKIILNGIESEYDRHFTTDLSI